MIRMLVQGIGAFLAVLTLAVTMGVPRKYLVYASVTGGVGWCIYLVLMEMELKEFMAMFAATILVSLISHIFARILKSPVSIFLIPGILPLVPGLGMYRTVYYIMQEDNEVAGYYLSNTMQIAGMIALAIFFVDTLFRIVRKK